MRRLATSMTPMNAAIGDPKRPSYGCMKFQQLFAFLVWVMAIVLGVMAIINAKTV
jgi:hypothetical protein